MAVVCVGQIEAWFWAFFLINPFSLYLSSVPPPAAVRDES
eukprot:COSAG06_NODE_24481_length_661_cov_1.188612_1_plen_39_part_10